MLFSRVKHDMRPFSCGVVSYERLCAKASGCERGCPANDMLFHDEWRGERGREREDEEIYIFAGVRVYEEVAVP